MILAGFRHRNASIHGSTAVVTINLWCWCWVLSIGVGRLLRECGAWDGRLTIDWVWLLIISTITSVLGDRFSIFVAISDARETPSAFLLYMRETMSGSHSVLFVMGIFVAG